MVPGVCVLLWLWCPVSASGVFQTGGALGSLLSVEQSILIMLSENGAAREHWSGLDACVPEMIHSLISVLETSVFL